ncbi:hypothetical protein KR018_001126 [Drosophila ironensis]|nr:hypothetical protein KR018_001126 [Drosophila ironensis]
MGANLSGSQTVEPLPKSVDMSPESLPKQDLKAQQDPKDQLPKAAPEAGNTPANPQPDKDKPMEQPMPTKPPIEVFPEVQPVSAVKFQKSKSNSRSMIGAIQDMQRMPEAAIHEEFSRRIQNFQQRLVPLGDPPCQDVAARMQACLQKSSQRACNCFEVGDLC